MFLDKILLHILKYKHKDNERRFIMQIKIVN